MEKFSHSALGAELSELHVADTQLRTAIFDCEKDYSLDDVTELNHSLYRGIGVQETADIAARALEIARSIYPSDREPTQAELNELYGAIAALKLERLEAPPQTPLDDIQTLVNKLDSVDSDVCEYLAGQFVFYSDGFTFKNEDLPDRTLNFVVNDSFLKFECFFAAASAATLHLMREVAENGRGFLARVVLSRSMLECALQLHFVTKKFLGLASRIENKQSKTSLQEFEMFPLMFQKAMFGSSNPDNPDLEDPYHINSCLDALPSDVDSTIDQARVKHLYDQLCDYTHPNFGLRSVLIDFKQNPSDYFTTMTVIDESLSGQMKRSRLIDLVPAAYLPTVGLFEASFQMLEEIRERLNGANVQAFGDATRFNKVTSPARRRGVNE